MALWVIAMRENKKCKQHSPTQHLFLVAEMHETLLCLSPCWELACWKCSQRESANARTLESKASLGEGSGGAANTSCNTKRWSHFAFALNTLFIGSEFW